MPAITIQSDRVEIESHLKILFFSGIFSCHQIRLQAYMVPIVTEITGIFGYIFDHDFTHIWSPSK